MSGYSGTPLAAKLGFKTGFTARLIRPPDQYFTWLEPLPSGILFEEDPASPKDLIHIFMTAPEELLQIPVLKKELKPAGMIWVSWPKKSSGVPTLLNEDIIRKEALAAGLVDIKVCAVSKVWSGLKLVIPVSSRTSH